MKKHYILVLLFLLSANVWSQSPEKMSYQAVIRDSDNNLVSNQTVGIQISILQGSASGTAVYVETHEPTANENGLVTLEIGTGAVVSGDFSSIDWSAGPYFLKNETDPSGGNDYSTSGTCELLSVPFALYAKNSGNAFSGHYTDLVYGGTGQSVFIGEGAGTHDDLTDNQNVFTGDSTGFQNTTGHKNTALGFAAFFSNTEGFGNTATGYRSLFSNTTGKYNSATGYRSLYHNTLGTYNTASGNYALYSNTQGNNNTANGSGSLASNTIGMDNTASGYQALYHNETGSNNTANGFRSLHSNTSGDYNIAIGAEALFSNTTRNGLVAVGYGALHKNAETISDANDGVRNTALGFRALYNNTVGYSNTGIGYQALTNNTEGGNNTAVGNAALFFNTSGSINTALGNHALSSNTSGYCNTAMGHNALYANTTGTHNTGIGCRSLLKNVTGSRNTAVGYYAGPGEGNDNLFNSGAFGYGAEVSSSNTIRIGDNNITMIYGAVAWGSPSDKRFKTNVTPNVPGLDFIMKLQPVTFNWDLEAMDALQGKDAADKEDPKMQKARRAKEEKVYTGFVAQEVEKAAEACGYDFSGVHQPDNDKSTYHLSYSKFVVPLVQALQEQQKHIKNLQEKMAEQDKRIESLIDEIEQLK